MQYTVNRGEKGKVEVKVDVTSADFLKVYEETLEALAKEVKVDGFRSGNVPRDVLEGKIGANKILNEAASFLISKNLSEIFKKENVVPLGNPSVAIQNLAKGSPFSFTATVVSKPKIKIGDWKQIKVKKVKVREVTDADITQSIKNIHEAWLEKSKVKSQKSKVDEDQDGEEDHKSGKFIYDAHGNKIFIKDEESKSKSKVESGAAPDDEFAKAIGARDLVHLRELVKKDLEQIMLDRLEAKLEEELFDELLKIAEVELPDILVDDEINRIIVRISQNLEQQGKKLDDYLKEENTTLDSLKAKLRPQAEKNVKIMFAMDEIGSSEKIQITKEEIDNAAKGVDESKLSDAQKADLRNYLAVSVFQAKTLDLVKKTVAT